MNHLCSCCVYYSRPICICLSLRYFLSLNKRWIFSFRWMRWEGLWFFFARNLQGRRWDVERLNFFFLVLWYLSQLQSICCGLMWIVVDECLKWCCGFATTVTTRWHTFLQLKSRIRIDVLGIFWNWSRIKFFLYEALKGTFTF